MKAVKHKKSPFKLAPIKKQEFNEDLAFKAVLEGWSNYRIPNKENNKTCIDFNDKVSFNKKNNNK